MNCEVSNHYLLKKYKDFDGLRKEIFISLQVEKRMDRFKEIKVRVFDAFIDKFAERYVQQRSFVDEEAIRKAAEMDCGLDISCLMDVIRRNSCFVDPEREAGKQSKSIMNDVYRSDLGELLTTYYFEEKLPEGERYTIPLKNISSRELYNMPGRGLDAIGFRKEADGSYTLLLSEAKVSNEKRNPPRVVHYNDDSIYKTHKEHHDNLPMVLQRLTDYLRKLPSGEGFMAIACIVIMLEKGDLDKLKITYGCGLVRDMSCVDVSRDFGKMQTNLEEFRPGEVDFAIFTFTEKNIDEAVDLFYHKVIEITR